MLRSLSQTHKERLLEQQLTHIERRNAAPVGFKGFNTEGSLEGGSSLYVDDTNQKASLRKEMLRSLVEAQPPPPDKPPSRMPTKEEKELLKLSLSLEAYSMVNSENAGALAALSPLQTTSSKDLDKNLTATIESPFSANSTAGSVSPSPTKSPHPIFGEKPSTAAESTKSQKKAMLQLKKALIGKSISFLTNGDSPDVCLSAMGIPSLWSVPGEKDIFGQRVGVPSTVQDNEVPPAFSDQSLKAMLREGLIDVEAMRILRKVGKNADNVSVYERSQPTLLVRSPSMSTSVTLPSLDNIRRTEIQFGVQKVVKSNSMTHSN